MDISIDSNEIADALQRSASKSIADSLGGYSVQKAIADVVTAEVANGAIGEALRRSVKEIDTEELVQVLASEMQRHICKAVVHILQEGVTSSVYRLRCSGTYSYLSEEEKENRAHIKHELFGEGGQP